jgi:hypothetical protein
MQAHAITVALVCVFLLCSLFEMKNRIARYTVRNSFLLTLLYAFLAGTYAGVVVIIALLHKTSAVLIDLPCLGLFVFSSVRLSKLTLQKLNQ